MQTIRRLIGRAPVEHLSAWASSMGSVTGDALRHGVAVARWRMPIYRLQGRLVETGQPARVELVDHRGRVPPCVHALFDEPVTPEPVGYACWPRLHQALDRLAGEADLIVLRLNADFGRWWSDLRYVAMPEAVECHAELAADGSLPERARISQHKNLRALRNTNLRWEVSHRLEDFEQFYHRMYLPFTQHRFKDAASIRSASFLRRGFRRGGLMWILDGDERVAGSIYTLENQTLRGWVLGTTDMTGERLKQGMTTATYAFGFQLARQLGTRHFNMGLTPPDLNAGVLRFKKRWGAKVRGGRCTYCNYYLRWDRFNSVVARLLRQTPPLFHDGPDLSGLVAVDDSSPIKSVGPLVAEIAVPGLRRLCVLTAKVEQMQRVPFMNEHVRDMDVRLLPHCDSGRLGELLYQPAPLSDDLPTEKPPTREATSAN